MYQFRNGTTNGFVVAYKKPYDESVTLAEFSQLIRAASFINEARNKFGGQYKIFSVINGQKEEIWDSHNSDF